MGLRECFQNCSIIVTVSARIPACMLGAPSPACQSTTPGLPQGYKELYTRKWSYTRELAVSIQAGLQKMVEAKEDVNKMKAELAVKNQARGPHTLRPCALLPPCHPAALLRLRVPRSRRASRAPPTPLPLPRPPVLPL